MNFLQKIIQFYIKSSLHVALAVFCLLQITFITSHIKFDFDFSFCVFFGTVLGYNFLKYQSVFSFKKQFWHRYFDILLVTTGSFFGFLFYYFQLSNPSKFALLATGFLVLLYPTVRKNGLLKLFWVSATVAFITASIPLLSNFYPTKYIIIQFIGRFLFLSALLVPFEIIDSTSDSQSYKTIPQEFGVSKTKYLGYFLLISTFAIQYIFSSFSSLYLISDIIIYVISGLFIFFATTKRNRFYTLLWVEAIPIFWIFIYFCAKLF